MSKKNEPSPEQTRVLDYLQTHGGILVRRPGGFWSTPDTAGQQVAMTVVPDWYTSIQTVRAMEKKGLLARKNRFHEEWRDDRECTFPSLQPMPPADVDFSSGAQAAITLAQERRRARRLREVTARPLEPGQ